VHYTIEKGKADGLTAWNNGPDVQLTFKAGTPLPPELLDADREHGLSIIAQSKDIVVVFDSRQEQTSKRKVFVVARSDLAAVHMWYPQRGRHDNGRPQTK
jgi:hypothetical protein